MRVSKGLSFGDEESFEEAVGSLLFFNNPTSDPDSLSLRRVGSSSSSMPPQERDEDICLNNSLGDPNPLQRVGSSSDLNTWAPERSEVI